MAVTQTVDEGLHKFKVSPIIEVSFFQGVTTIIIEVSLISEVSYIQGVLISEMS